jgi:hypothetical protein
MLQILGAAAAAVTILGGLIRAVAAFRRRGTAGVTEARLLAVEAGHVFAEIVAMHGLSTDKWFTKPRRAIEHGLVGLPAQVRDRKLRRSCEALRDAWGTAWASAPAPYVAVAVPGRPTVSNHTPERQGQIERQVEAARRGLEASAEVEARCDRIG